jgi:hypothetical protein
VTGNATISGFEDFRSVNFSSGTLTVSANASPLWVDCTLGSKIVTAASTSIITMNNCQFNRPTVDDYNIDMANGGQLILRGVILVNKGTTKVNINLAGASTSASTPNMFSGIAGNVGCIADTAYLIVAPDCILPVLTGSAIHPTAARLVAVYALPLQSASIASTSLLTCQVTGTYRVSASLRTTRAGSAGTVIIALDGATAGSGVSQTDDLSTLLGRAGASVTVFKAAGETIAYTTTVAAAAGSPQYLVEAVVEHVM